MTDMSKKDSTTIQGAANIIHVKRRIIENWIEEGRIECVNGRISLSDVYAIKDTIEAYISLESFLNDHQTEQFNPKYVRNRDKYIDYLEENDYWGISVVYPEEMKYAYETNASFYIKRSELDRLTLNSAQFFEYFGLTEKAKCDQIINSCSDKRTKEQLETFLRGYELYTPKITAFLNEAIKLEVQKMDERIIADSIRELSLVGSKDLLIKFVNFVNRNLSLGLGTFDRKQEKSSKDIEAYSYPLYVKIAKSIFNEDKIIENRVLEKCFDKSINFETWLYLSIHFICGWRSGDICNNWQYVNSKHIQSLGLELSQIKEQVLGNTISNEVYYKIGEYIEKRIEIAGIKAHKTGKASDLLAPIGKELKIFFGRMALISAYHLERNREGILIEKRTSEYRNFVRVKELFGNDIYEMMGRTHLSSRKLNKSYLQSIEERARMNGAGTMAAYTIASYARNHSDIDTTARYIYDHGLNGETAEVVLALMLDRGVLGSIRYSEFLMAFPEAFKLLNAREKTQILSICGTSAYEMEIIGADIMAQIELKKSFSEGEKEKALSILHEMFEISHGMGKAKDVGVFCKKRALGYACDNPIFESCVANVCPHLVFTESGIKSLVNVIYEYVAKAKETNNPKYETILTEIIIPTYKSILSEVRNKMKPEEVKALKIAIGEFNGEHIKNN